MGDYIVTGPDGRKYKMTADSPEAVEHAARQMFGGGAPAAPSDTGGTAVTEPPAAAAPEPSLTDRIMSGGRQGLIGLRQGAAMLAGLPVDLAALVQNAGTYGVNKLFGTEIPYATNPVGGSGTFDAIFAAPARAGQAALGLPQEDAAPNSWSTDTAFCAAPRTLPGMPMMPGLAFSRFS